VGKGRTSDGTNRSDAATETSPRPLDANTRRAPGGTADQGVEERLMAPALDASNLADSSGTWGGGGGRRGRARACV
jgi:hypothetical protein